MRASLMRLRGAELLGPELDAVLLEHPAGLTRAAVGSAASWWRCTAWRSAMRSISARSAAMVVSSSAPLDDALR
jgi:hypothetical protein